jgi:hypothetical protein
MYIQIVIAGMKVSNYKLNFFRIWSIFNSIINLILISKYRLPVH